ncbi:MAG: biotin/lipoyl-binding protein, partial [Candidatus Binatus sp.]
MEARLSQKDLSKKDRRHLIGWLVAMFVVLTSAAAVVVSRTYAISAQRSELDKVAEAGPHVLVSHPQTASAERRLTLPATIQGYEETPVYAKIAGYLKEIRVDKGDRVKKGQVLAILESPELDEQVADAEHYLWLESVTDKRDQGL